MAKCDQCGEHESMPYDCPHCGGTYCSDHRLPENHGCPGLEEWGDPDGVFDSGFDESVNNPGEAKSGSVLDRLGLDTGRGGVLGYFRGNVTYVFLALMWLTFFAQRVYLGLFVNVNQAGNVTNPGSIELYESIFYLTTAHPEYVWTWFTSIFAHGGLWHVAGNSIIIFFFGRLVERYVGSRDYVLLFLGSGALAGLGQIAVNLALGQFGGVLGASGAGLAIMGVLTILRPDLRVYLWFLIPVPIWAITGFYAVVSVGGIFGFGIGGISGSGIANGAHLVGLIIGLIYGKRVEDSVRLPNDVQFGGGRGPGGPGRGGGRGPF